MRLWLCTAVWLAMSAAAAAGEVVHVIAARGEFRPTIDEARASALSAVRKQLVSWMEEGGLPESAAPGLKYLRDDMRPREDAPEWSAVGSGEKYCQVRLIVEVRAQDVRAWRGKQRLLRGLELLAGVWVVVAALWGALKVEELSRGYLTRWLAALALLAALGVAAWLGG